MISLGGFMMKRSPILVSLLVGLASLLSAAPPENIRREFARTSEKEIAVIVDVAFGSLYIERGAKGKIATVDYEDDKDSEHRIDVSYDVRGEHGTLRIRSKKHSGIWNSDDSDHGGNDRRVTVVLTEDIPLTIDVELGAGKGDLDVSGLKIKELHISTGASSVNLRCEVPNPISADEIEIESGVSKFTAQNLSNINFRKLRFSGGVGSYKLDFGGTLRQSGNVNIEVGLGSVVVTVPKQIAARLEYDDNWLSSFDLDDDFSQRRGDTYETEDFGRASERLTIRLDSGLGSVKVRRR
jgi:DUF4097 and DUF4098 domain-containing protein YvlB